MDDFYRDLTGFESGWDGLLVRGGHGGVIFGTRGDVRVDPREL